MNSIVDVIAFIPMAGLFLFFIIYVNVFVLNLFYHLFTGKHLKIYEKFSSCIGNIIKQFFNFVDTLF